jgi:hypothetical protein
MANLQLEILPQPDDETCGATCLQAIYKYYGENADLLNLIKEIPTWETGGTIAVLLGIHALSKNYKVTIYTYNLHVFDPTWFHHGIDLVEKLKLQLKEKTDNKVIWASRAYIEFLEKGGEIRFEELNTGLIKKYLKKEIPILTGLNATYLYRCAREYKNEFDDIRGTSMGHFVILNGYDSITSEVQISDPLHSNPFSNHTYQVSVDRVINSIMLGIMTYDANLLIIQKNK